jgi:purine-cytosine permease-like protein
MGNALIRRWEALPGGAQALLSFAVFAALAFAMHITVLDQPLARAIGYGAFYGFVFMLLALWATRSEQTRRRVARGDDE